MTTVIRQQDLIDSVSDALQFMSYYHPRDFIKAMSEAHEREESQSAKDAMAQILINSRMCAEGHRPICQDTGIVTVFLEIGMDVQWDATDSLDNTVNEGVRQAYLNPDNVLRASIVADPEGTRQNTDDNTPAVIHYKMVPGNKVKVRIAAKGGGSEAKARFTMLNPSDSVADWVLGEVPKMGAGWCPPGMLGIGIGGTADKAMVMAKEALLEPVDMHELKSRGPSNRCEELRLELYDGINQLGIGAQGLGGLTTVLDVKVADYPTHAANKPVAIIPNCAATRHAEFELDGTGPAYQEAPSLDEWPNISREIDDSVRRVKLNTLTRHEMQHWQCGERLLLSGNLLTGRDAAHKKILEMIGNGEQLPLDLKDRFIYYVGPVDPVGDEVVGPAGPTTASRMDKFTRTLLEQKGLMGMIGKAERGHEAIEAIRDNKAVYLIAVGGAAYLVSKAIKSAEIVAFEELGMEAIYEFRVEDMPVTVAVDPAGTSVHSTGSEKWRARIIESREA